MDLHSRAGHRCLGTDAYRFGGTRVCDNKQVRTDKMEQAVWNDVCELLRNPNLLREEYERRLLSPQVPSAHRKSLVKQVEQSQRTVNRLIDAYSDGVIDREEFDPRLERARTQLAKRKETLNHRDDRNSQQESLRASLACLESFAAQIRAGLGSADWNTRREILRTAIDHIQIEPDRIRITYRIDFPLFLDPAGNNRILQYRWRQNHAAFE